MTAAAVVGGSRFDLGRLLVAVVGRSALKGVENLVVVELVGLEEDIVTCVVVTL